MSDDRDSLFSKKCVPCEGGVPALSLEEATRLLLELQGWSLGDDGKRIFKRQRAKHFREAMRYLNAIAETAEAEGHHPDLHLESYREIRIEIWTHAIGGLSENDFILAAKIDRLPIETR